MSEAAALKLLIAEDQAALRRLIGAVVAKVAGEVRDCVQAQELQQVYTDWAPDFVLIDGDMTSLDGIAVTRWIKAADPLGKVIIVSSYDSPELREAAVQAGALGYVMKDDLMQLSSLLVLHR
jgi:DNA-binding NarL/FixJ family response regulator